MILNLYLIAFKLGELSGISIAQSIILNDLITAILKLTGCSIHACQELRIENSSIKNYFSLWAISALKMLMDKGKMTFTCGLHLYLLRRSNKNFLSIKIMNGQTA
jgi:hypothetical protein